jgi:hypothetical protein
MKILTIIIVAYLLLIFDLTVTYKNKKYEYKLQYYGLLWVVLDYWSIKKYKSSDKPIKWITINKIKL